MTNGTRGRSWPSGLILGPVVLAVTDALIEIWRRRTAGGRPAERDLASAA